MTLEQIIHDEWTGEGDAAEPREGLYMFDYLDGGGVGGGGGGAPVELTLPRTSSRGPYRPPKRYRSTVRLITAVHDNVIALRVPRPAQDALPSRMVWKGPGGETVRVVRNPR